MCNSLVGLNDCILHRQPSKSFNLLRKIKGFLDVFFEFWPWWGEVFASVAEMINLVTFLFGSRELRTEVLFGYEFFDGSLVTEGDEDGTEGW